MKKKNTKIRRAIRLVAITEIVDKAGVLPLSEVESEGLTDRQQIIVRLKKCGNTQCFIAEALGVTESLISQDVKAMRAKASEIDRSQKVLPTDTMAI